MEQTVSSRPMAPATLSLSRLLAENRAILLLGAMLLLALFSRFWELGARALHHDESLHALYSYYLYRDGNYQHDPMMHGPILFHLTALGYWIAGGASDFTARLVPAILGILLVWAPWKFRSWLGVRGALVTSALILISPTALYYSRFIREDVFAAAWTVWIVYGMWKYLEGGEDFHLYLMAAGWGLLFSQKETSFLTAFVFWTFLALVVALRYTGRLGRQTPVRQMREWHLLVLLGALLLPHASAVVLHLIPGMDPASGYNASAYKDLGFILRAGSVTLGLFFIGLGAASKLWDGRKFLVASGIFYLIFVLFHTTFLTWPFGIGSGMVGALGYWIEQHGVERGGQPWYYYSLLLPLYEFLPILLGVVGGGLLLMRRRHTLPPVQESVAEESARRRRGGRSRRAAEPSAPDGESESPDAGAEAGSHLNAAGMWPYFNLWWFAFMFFILSYAGEKMPWLLLHIAIPLHFLAGWAMGRFLDGVEWERLRRPEALGMGLLSTIALFAAVTILWMALASEWPFGGTELAALNTTARWLGALLFGGAAAWGAYQLRGRTSGTLLRQTVIIAVSLVLALMSVRFATIAAFRNADMPNEPLIYTQSAPDVPRVMREIEMISERIAGGKNLKVAYDNSTLWPFEWYLRDYPNKFYYGSSPSTYADSVRDASVVLVGLDNDHLVTPLLPGYIRHHYSMRPNFPENYKNLMQVATTTTHPDGSMSVQYGEQQPHNPFTILGNILRLAGQSEARAEFLNFLWNRRIEGELGRYDFVVYVKPEVAAEVWQYGLTVATLDPELTKDPLAETMVQLAPTRFLTADFRSPKNLAVLPDGRLVVADTGNHRLRILERDGTVVRDIGGFGEGPGEFNEPWGVAAAPDGTLYVADTWNSRIQHLTVEGEVLHVWGTFADTAGQMHSAGAFWGPRDVAVDDEGTVYVTDTGNKRVQTFDPEGEFLGQFGGPGALPGQLAEPVGVAVAPNGTIWVSDTWNRRIQSFARDFDFTPQLQLPLRAWSGQSINNKPYIAASNEKVWVTDPEGFRIIELDHSGEVLRVWGGGDAQSSLNLPFGLAFDGEMLWVADSENHRIVGYEID